MIESELDIPSLTDDGIQMNGDSFIGVKELHSSSMIDELLLIEMLILLIDSFNRRVFIFRTIVISKVIILYPTELIVFVDNEWDHSLQYEY